MAWIESHQELARHPKTKKFARKVGITVPAAIGYLHLLWWWAMDYAQDGDLSLYEPDDIADALMWDGSQDDLLAALIESGFLENDDGLFIHDWHEYAGRLLEKRKQNTERKRKSRDSHARQTSDTNKSHGATVPNQTIPNQNTTTTARASEEPESFYKAHERVFGFGCNPLQAEKLGAYIDQDGLEEAVVIRAIERAAVSGTGHSFKLIEKILNDYLASGVKTIQQAESFDNEFERRKKANPARGKPNKTSLSSDKQEILEKFRKAGLK